MTAALARRCASISQLRHAGLSWNPLLSSAEGGPSSQAGTSCGRSQAAGSNCSSHDVGLFVISPHSWI